MNSEKTWHERRVKKIVIRSIDRYDLNLDGFTVFTEAASGDYAYTPIIAGLSKAKMVYAFARDSKYGKREDIRKHIMALATKYGVEDRISVVYEKEPEIIGKCDIITNSAFVRPIDIKMIEALKETAVIPLMFETWEFRKEDLDLDYCKKKGVPVLGTNEDRDGADLFDCLGFLVSKILFECGIEIYKNNILILGGSKIARAFQAFFKKNRIKNTMITFIEGGHAPQHGVFYYKFFEDETHQEEYDVVIFAEHLNNILLLGKDGVINSTNINKFANSSFVHICGKVDEGFVKENEIKIYPENPAPFGHMTMTGDYLGPLIPIELITAGLKVGEIMARLRKEGKTYDEVMEIASKNPLVSSFSDSPEIDTRAKNVSNPELLNELRKLHYELRDFTKIKYNRVNPFYEDLISWEEKGAFWGGKGVVVYDSTTIAGDVEIGDNTWIGPFCDLDGGGKLTIGRNCSVSAGVQILTHDTVKWALSAGKFAYEYSPVKIGDCCFIGAHSVVMRGVTIGKCSVVGAGAVVTKDVSEYSIVAGVPAKPIGKVNLLENGDIELNYDKR